MIIPKDYKILSVTNYAETYHSCKLLPLRPSCWLPTSSCDSCPLLFRFDSTSRICITDMQAIKTSWLKCKYWHFTWSLKNEQKNSTLDQIGYKTPYISNLGLLPARRKICARLLRAMHAPLTQFPDNHELMTKGLSIDNTRQLVIIWNAIRVISCWHHALEVLILKIGLKKRTSRAGC